MVRQFGSNKTIRIRDAIMHNNVIHNKYMNDVYKSSAGSRIFDDSTRLHRRNIRKWNLPNIKLVNTDTLSAAIQYEDSKTCLLDFANYKHPGGKYMEGSLGQEESLCHESNLYQILSLQADYYKHNRKHLNGSLYKNRALFIPDVLFIRGDIEKKYHVITCSAPEYDSKLEHNVSHYTNTRKLYFRIKFILDIAESYNIDTLVLGAFGCNEFNQNPLTVATYFMQLLTDPGFGYAFKNIIFAIPKDTNDSENFIAFQNVLQNSDTPYIITV